MIRPRTLSGSAVCLLLVLGLLGSASARAAERVGSDTDDDAGALSALHRAIQAGASIGYEGTQVVATWTPSGTTTRMIEVRQQPDGRRWTTVQQAGSAGRVTTEWSPDENAGSEPPGFDPLDLLAGEYRISIGMPGRVAGRTTMVVLVRRGSQLAARLWVDQQCGLLLREEVFDTEGRLTRLTSFVDLTVDRGGASARAGLSGSDPNAGSSSGGSSSAGDSGAGPSSISLPAGRGSSRDESKLSSSSDTAGSSSTLVLSPLWPSTSTARPASLGFSYPRTLPGGFQVVDTRVMNASASAAGSARVVHLTYTDGLSALSVFAESGRLPRSGVPGLTRQKWGDAVVYLGTSWPTRVVWEGDGRVLTLVSDAPIDELRSVVSAMPHGGPQRPGVLTRLKNCLRALTHLWS